MARRKTLIKLLDELTPDVRDAFLAAIANVRRETDLNDLIKALQARDIDRALQIIPMRAEYLAPLDRALSDAYRDGGDWIAKEINALAKAQGVEVVSRFNPRNLRAEAFMAERAARNVTEVFENTKDELRAVMTQGFRSGSSAKQLALDLVGRSPDTGRQRRGGIVGLHSLQISEVRTVQSILSDPDEIRRYFIKDRETGKWKPRYTTTDRRFDRQVRNAIEAGRALDAEQIERVSTLHSNRLLRLRGESIARTELIGSLSHAKYEGLTQLVDRGEVTSQDIDRSWDSAEDGATRPTHVAADGQKRKHGEAFSIGGYLMMHVGDASLGAPVKEIARCRCNERIDIDFLAGLGR